jgi:hypothetical protein
MTKEEQVEKAVRDFVLQQSGDFQLQDILDALAYPATSRKKGVPKKDIIDILDFNAVTFSRDAGRVKIPETFTPRHSYFKNARFMVSPKPKEIAQGILIPGHRFIPFLSPEVKPWDCTLLTPEGTPLACKTISQKLADLTIHYTLFGIENMENMLVLDQESNAEALIDKESTHKAWVTLTVFDFADLYRMWRFTPEDSIIFEVQDWLKGIYILEYVSKEKRRELITRSEWWIEKLEKAFLQTFDIFGLKIPMEEQIAYAYFYGGKEILQEPPIHLGGILEVSDQVHIIPFGIQTRLWHETEFNLAQLSAHIADFSKKKGFDAFLESVYAPCSEIEVEAFIQDEMYRHKGLVTEEGGDASFNAVIKRIFGDDIAFFTDGQREELSRYFQKLWKKNAQSYNYFKDQTTGKVRGVLLEIFESYYDWVRTLNAIEIIPAEIPIQMMTGVSQAHNTLIDYLWLLDNSEVEDEKAICSLFNVLPAVNTTLESLKERVLDQITANRKQPGNSKLRLVKPSELQEDALKAPKHIFVLRISLKYTQPQIWRSVQVPGSFTLGDLHEVIQIAMGWQDEHLHKFKINTISYGPAMEDDVIDLGIEHEDEEHYTLDELGLAEKQRFLYIYDFGDNWHHQILVSKILPAAECSAEDKQYPRCLRGKRACPPEDCGGISGYEAILEALAAPKKKKNREVLEWVGAFDPAYFDLDYVNKLLLSDEDEEDDDDAE